MKMQKTMLQVAVGIAMGVLAGCASTQMTAVPPDQLITRPDSGKALIYFARPSSFGGAIQATLFDDEQYIGTSSASTVVPYQATPGAHMFMVIGESADFLQADLSPGKTYYAEVTPRLGAWKARFSLRPQNGQIPDKEVEGWMQSCKQVKPNESGLDWAQQNIASIKQKKNEYLPRWQSKNDADKQILRAESGR